MNIARYNYFVWQDQIANWLQEERLQIATALDLGSGDGTFLSGVLRRGLTTRGYGVDRKPATVRAPSISFYMRDLTRPEFADGIPTCDLVFFMNMLFVPLDLTEIERYLARGTVPHLVVAIPGAAALEEFERRHPGVNCLDRSLSRFLSTTGYQIHRSCRLVSYFYLRSPLRVFIGGWGPAFARRIEAGGESAYYSLVWAKKVG